MDFLSIWFSGRPTDIMDVVSERKSLMQDHIEKFGDFAGDRLQDAHDGARRIVFGPADAATGDAGHAARGGASLGRAAILDADGDGKVELEDMIQAKVEGPRTEEAVWMDSKRRPIFILTTTALAFILWFATAVQDQGEGTTQREQDKTWTKRKGGLDSVFPGKTDLRINWDCKDYRAEVWRWVTYQFTHVGFTHVGMNSLMNVLLGIPLERLHGTVRMAIMYNLGVMGGALCYFIADSRHFIVGMSGGCYSLIGTHLAGLIINWHQKRYRKVVVAFLVILALVDLLNYLLLVDRDGEDRPSYSAHAGGYIAGVLTGIVLGENLHVKEWEIHFRRFALILALVCCVFCMVWAMFWPPMTIFDPYRWCWFRQVYNKTLFGDRDWHCVRCGTQTCIDKWDLMPWLSHVTMAVCDDRGFDMDE